MEQKKQLPKGKVKFIRKNGKVIPIAADKYKAGPSSQKRQSRKYGIKKGEDGAMKEQRIKEAYEKKATKKSGAFKWGALAAGSLVGSVAADAAGKGKLGLGLFAAGIGAALVGSSKQRKARKSLEGEKNLAIGRHVYGGQKQPQQKSSLAGDGGSREKRYKETMERFRKTKRGQKVMADIQKRKEAQGKPLTSGQISYAKRAEKTALKNADFFKQRGNSAHEDKWRRTAAIHRKKYETGF